MRQAHRLFALIVAFGFVFGPAALYAAGVRPQAFENRKLAAAPDPDEGWAFFDDLPPWAADHLPGRRHAVRATSWVDYHLLGSLPRTGATTPRTSTAPDGEKRTRAPLVIRGSDGYLFYGPEFDVACNAGKDFTRGLRNLAALADVIERSGRRVVLTVAPNKSSVVTNAWPRAIPHGDCSRNGIRSQQAQLDAHTDPPWLSVRDSLRQRTARGEQVYWKTDTHWTTVGSGLYAQALAKRLTGSAATLPLANSSVDRRGDLTALVGLTFLERAPGAVVENGTTTTPTSGSGRYDPTKDLYDPITWRTRPSKNLVPGKTVILGDSFGYYGLSPIRHVFANGTFVWVGPVGLERVEQEIVAADTVVLEIAQRMVGYAGNPIVNPRLRRQLEARFDPSSD